MLTDQELLEAMRNDDERSLLTLHQRYGKSMFITAAKRLNSPEDAEEIIMDIFHNLWRNRNTFELRHENLRGYFTKAVANHVFRFIQQQTALKLRQQQLQDEYVSPASSSPENELLIKELYQKIEGAIKSLPEQCKIVFHMYHDDNLSRKEIADRLNITENTVKYHLKRANIDIKNNLKSSSALLPWQWLWIFVENNFNKSIEKPRF